MQNYREKLLVLFIITNVISVFSQNNTNSPYSRYGIGEIDRSGFAENRAMGGLGISLRNTNQINILNPASYSSQDTNSFIFDVGMYGKFVNTSTSNAHDLRKNFNINYITMSFPISHKYYACLGITPFSNVGYQIREIDSSNNNVGTVSHYFSGSGGLYQVFFGNSVKLLNDNLSLGVNLSYLFGDINYIDTTAFPNDFTGTYSTILNNDVNVSGIYLNFGLQYKQKLNNDLNLLAGFIFDPKMKLKANYNQRILRDFSSDVVIDTALAGEVHDHVTLPQKIGFGVSLQYKDKLIAGIDYSHQNWGNASLWGLSQTMKPSNNYNAGLEYTPNKKSIRSYFAKVHYRFGGYYSNTNLFVNNKQINDYGLSFGFGFPVKNSGSAFNISFEFGRRGSTQNQLIQEDYSRITFSLSLFDSWFMKRRFD